MSLLSDLVLPSNISYLLFFAGLLARFWPRGRLWSWPLLVTSGAITVLFSSGWVAAGLLRPLERQYAAWEPGNPAPIAAIVVLSGWAADDPAMPVTGRLNASSAYRVMMTAEIHRSYPHARIIVSGDIPTTRAMAAALEALAIPRQAIVLEQASKSTADSAAHVQPLLLRNEPFILVTSAGHMRRSLAAFAALGLRAHPAPTEHRFPARNTARGILPRPSSLASADLAVHEYVGYWWYRVTGRT